MSGPKLFGQKLSKELKEVFKEITDIETNIKARDLVGIDLSKRNQFAPSNPSIAQSPSKSRATTRLTTTNSASNKTVSKHDKGETNRGEEEEEEGEEAMVSMSKTTTAAQSREGPQKQQRPAVSGSTTNILPQAPQQKNKIDNNKTARDKDSTTESNDERGSKDTPMTNQKKASLPEERKNKKGKEEEEGDDEDTDLHISEDESETQVLEEGSEEESSIQQQPPPAKKQRLSSPPSKGKKELQNGHKRPPPHTRQNGRSSLSKREEYDDEEEEYGDEEDEEDEDEDEEEEEEDDDGDERVSTRRFLFDGAVEAKDSYSDSDSDSDSGSDSDYESCSDYSEDEEEYEEDDEEDKKAEKEEDEFVYGARDRWLMSLDEGDQGKTLQERLEDSGEGEMEEGEGTEGGGGGETFGYPTLDEFLENIKYPIRQKKNDFLRDLWDIYFCMVAPIAIKKTYLEDVEKVSLKATAKGLSDEKNPEKQLLELVRYVEKQCGELFKKVCRLNASYEGFNLAARYINFGIGMDIKPYNTFLQDLKEQAKAEKEKEKASNRGVKGKEGGEVEDEKEGGEESEGERDERPGEEEGGGDTVTCSITDKAIHKDKACNIHIVLDPRKMMNANMVKKHVDLVMGVNYVHMFESLFALKHMRELPQAYFLRWLRKKKLAGIYSIKTIMDILRLKAGTNQHPLNQTGKSFVDALIYLTNYVHTIENEDKEDEEDDIKEEQEDDGDAKEEGMEEEEDE